jgi:hypothetical protein
MMLFGKWARGGERRKCGEEEEMNGRTKWLANLLGYGPEYGEERKKERLKMGKHANDEKYKCELHCEINGEISISEFFY